MYVLDNGLINSISIKYSDDLGRLFENSALIKLIGGFDDISYWSDLGSEVDFIVNRLAINVTATNNLNEREFEGLKDFEKKHSGFSSIIVTKSLTKGNLVAIRDFLIYGVNYNT